MSPSKAGERTKRAEANALGPGRLNTPPNSPIAQLPDLLEFARQFVDTIKLIQKSEPKEVSSGPALQVDPSVQQPGPVIQASKLEFKEVHEV
jgi:hypothetical protein